MTVNWHNSTLLTAFALVSVLVSQPADAATFRCGKVFVTFEGKTGDHIGIFTIRKAEISYVATSTNMGFSGLRYRLPNGELQTVNIDQATHDRLIVCLN